MISRSALLTTFLALASTFACTRETPTPTPIQEQPTADAAVDDKPVEGPKIFADEAVFDFGSVRPKESVEHVFTVRNVGDADLHIDRVQKT